MALGKNTAVVNELQRLFNVGVVRELSDGQLLERFAVDRSEAAELAFAVLVDRHGPMVLRVCRAVLADPHDTEDAFQATFLVLVKKARSLWVRDSLGPWLHQVAYRTASCARLAAARRRRHEGCAAAARQEIRTVHSNDLASLLHEEIERLPERYRAPVVLCDLEGRTHQQAARHLGWPVGTVKSRQARGRERLRERLRRRGLAPNAGLLGSGFVPVGPDPIVPAALVDCTTRAVVQFVTCQNAVRASTLSLVQGVLKAMSFTRWSKVASVVLVLGATVSGAGFLTEWRAPAAPFQAENEVPTARGDEKITITVRPGPLPVTVIERGSLEVSRSDDAYCMVEGQTVIIRIKPEGTNVKKGELICELDSAPLKDQLFNAHVTTKSAELAYQNAKTAREVAEIAVAEFIEGTFKQELDTAKAEAALAQSAIEKAEGRLDRARRARQRLSDAAASKKAAVTSSDIVAELDIDDRIDAAEQTLVREKKALELAKSKQAVLEKYTREKTIKALGVDLELKRAEELAKMANLDFQHSKERKLDRQIAACKITAPRDGTLVYANDPLRAQIQRAQMRPVTPAIEEGATVRERQKILSVIDLSGPKRVNTKVHERRVDQITTKMKARIRVDAFPDRVFDGTVVDMNALPDTRFFGQEDDSKVYTTRVRIDNGVPELRPGMTAEVEILIAKRENVLSVPVQAVIRYEGKDHVALSRPGGGIEWRDVTLGISNERYVEVTQGLTSGDTVVMNPVSLMSEQEKRDKLGAPGKRGRPR
jgi:HlyD family secretion protein